MHQGEKPTAKDLRRGPLLRPLTDAQLARIAARAGRGGVRRSGPPPVKMKARVYAVDIERRKLYERIDARLDERLSRGLVDEVRRLLEGGLPPARMMQLGLEYREVTAYLQGRKDFDAMADDLRRGIHLFAKRQQTWFRGMERRGLKVTWIAPGDCETILRNESKSG